MSELAENFAGALKLVQARPLRKIPGDHDGVKARRRRHLERGGHVFGHERVAAVNIRDVQDANACRARGGINQGAQSRRR